jgi:hypothetical protein
VIFLMIALILFLEFWNAAFDEFCLEHGVDQQFLPVHPSTEWSCRTKESHSS